jgi:hypothetical protein
MRSRCTLASPVMAATVVRATVGRIVLRG